MQSVPQQYTSQITELLIRMQTPPNKPENMPEPEYDRIIAALSHILSTGKFAAAPQMSAFLRYVVEQAAAGNKKRIKAYTVAVDALGKADDFDPQNDPVVRVLAGRLRASLTAYYEVHPDAEVVIKMTTGTYVPTFSFHQEDTGSPEQALNTAKSSDKVVPMPMAQNKLQESASATESLAEKEDAAGSVSKLESAGSVENTTALRHSAADKHPAESEYPDEQRKTVTSRTYKPDRNNPTSRYKMAFAVSAAALALLLVYTFKAPPQTEPFIVAALPQMPLAASGLAAERLRPDKLSVFVSALKPDNSLESQLNTLMSGVFSESEALRVYRILKTNQGTRYWPEDYLISLNVVPQADETQVNIQMIEAQSGRVGLSSTLSLNKMAANGLSREDLTVVMNFARQLSSPEGPMMTDYKSK